MRDVWSSRTVRGVSTAVALLVAVACEALGGGGDGTSGGGGGGSGGVVAGAAGGGAPAGAWSAATSPCPGSRTNAIWFDDLSVGYAGCGENAEGTGLFVTTDGGRTWTGAPAFEDVRVNDIRRGPDGVLYAAGIHTTAGTSAWRVEETQGALAPVALFTPGNGAFTAVKQAENVAVTASGAALVDSLTGTSVACRVAGGDFVEMHSVLEEAIADPDALGVQVRRVVAFGEGFYASGSVINQPAQVFLPSHLEGATCHLRSLALQPAEEDGELLDLHVWSATRAIVVGIDQTKSDALVFLLDGDADDRAAWTRVDLAASGIDYPAWIHAVRAVGDVVVLACEKIPTQLGGCLLRSADGGKTWQDATPAPAGASAGPLSAVWLFDNGDIYAAGGGREAWRFRAE